MPTARADPAYVLSIIIVFLMILASSAGLVVDDLYRDNLLVASGWFGNDLVTLFVAVPMLAGALMVTRRARANHRGFRTQAGARLIWLGLLMYVFYNYAFYLFGAAFNSLFLVYVALFALSGYALIFGLGSLDVHGASGQFGPRTPAKWIGGYMLLVGAILGVFWTSLSLAYVFTGEVPQVVVATGGRTNLIAALDLSMVVSVAFLGGTWLWKRKPWGYVLAIIWNVKGAVYMLALSAASLTAFRAGASEDLTQVALWGPIGVGCSVATLMLLAHLEPDRPTSR